MMSLELAERKQLWYWELVTYYFSCIRPRYY